jgi:hypothetical protein
MSKALREKDIVLSGSSGLRKNISKWLGQNYYADIKLAQ